MNLDGGTWLQRLLGGAADIATDYVRQEVRVELRSNLLPAITIYSGRAKGGGPGLGSLLGIKAGVVVTGSDGRQLLEVGQPARLDPIRFGVLLLAVGGVVYLIIRGVRA